MSPLIPTPKSWSPPLSASSACPPPTKPSSSAKHIALWPIRKFLVAAGESSRPRLKKSGVALLPVDSEHNAIHQCLRGGETAKSTAWSSPPRAALSARRPLPTSRR